ncbi:hypothetical protein IQ266_10930 [filamentous cyanobacterium LEGE 11480]|uniref:Uncharacterized protein n=1 Tax=Romeriopsis navalis LEGE 11480 TaxID=2777977 RepID=A0A928Z340_9CYAN|nr:hypothetical protein [Romeriopsis navalis]MBE9030244.1 hypothetical protein [Romeriopsis navalis LEGE 11480]
MRWQYVVPPNSQPLLPTLRNHAQAEEDVSGDRYEHAPQLFAPLPESMTMPGLNLRFQSSSPPLNFVDAMDTTTTEQTAMATATADCDVPQSTDQQQLQRMVAQIIALKHHNQRLIQQQARSTNQISHLMAELEQLHIDYDRQASQLQTVKRDLARYKVRTHDMLPMMVPPVMTQSRRGHYVQTPLWERKQSIPFVRRCLKLLKLLLLLTFGFLLTIVVMDLLQLSGIAVTLLGWGQRLGPVILAIGLLTITAAWVAEAV